MNLKRGLLSTTGLGLLGVLVFASLNHWPQPLAWVADEGPGEPGKQPDYVIHNFHAVDLDEQGRLRYELSAEKLVHFAQPARARLVNPDMVFHRREDADLPDDPWELTAESGMVRGEGDELVLDGNVRVARTLPDAGQNMTLETAQLVVYGKREVATTSHPVVMRSALGELSGTGMELDMRNGRLELLANVRGHYDPP